MKVSLIGSLRLSEVRYFYYLGFSKGFFSFFILLVTVVRFNKLD